MTAELLVVLPVLGRPHRAPLVLESLLRATPEPFTVRVMATRGDTQVQAAYVQALEALGINGCVDILSPNRVGDFAKKTNHAYSTSTEPFIFTGADDLDFKDGWWTAARPYFDDPAIGVVGTNDLAPTERARAGLHSTHMIFRRSYVDTFGLIDGEKAIYHEAYQHEFVDAEAIGTAMKRNAWVYAADSVVEHLNAVWGKAPMDASYRASQRRMNLSRPLFNQRRKMWQ